MALFETIDVSSFLDRIALGPNSEQAEKFPGVTRVLGGTKDMTGLNAWKARVGVEEANRIVEESKQIGTSLDTIFNESLGPDRANFDLEAYKGQPGYKLFRQLTGHIKHIEPIGVQMKVFNNHLRYMGYLDCFGFYKGELAVIDCKNTKREKREEYLEDYYLQCTAYAMALQQMYGFVPKKIVLLMARRDSSFPQVVVRDTKEFVPAVISRAKQYYLSNPG